MQEILYNTDEETLYYENNSECSTSINNGGKIAEPYGIYSENNFSEDKYFSKMVDKVASLNVGGYITVGTILKNGVLNTIGLNNGKLYIDVSKLRYEMIERNDPIEKAKIKDIPKILERPIVISEYIDMEGVHSANVYGNLYVGTSPIVVGVMIKQSPKGNEINKIQTIHPKRNFYNDLSPDKILYLSENKKETKLWFQSLNAQEPFPRENKFGYIRSIAYED